jgi:hypothetical protein
MAHRFRCNLDHADLVSRLAYDAQTGIFTWIKPLSNVRKPGDRAGTTQKNGTRIISIDKRPFVESRLAWFYVTGSWPNSDIEHINGNPTDNRWSNLRESAPKASGAELTAARVREVLEYSPETGTFKWCQEMCAGRGSGRALVKAGDIAGGMRSNGYLAIAIDGRRYAAHRLAWLYVHGRWPAATIDHANGDPLDNRIVNLREATQQQNNCNSRKAKHNSSGFKGVSFEKRRRVFEAYISVNNRKVTLGRFPTAEEAHRAYCAAAEKLRGEFARFE